MHPVSTVGTSTLQTPSLSANARPKSSAEQIIEASNSFTDSSIQLIASPSDVCKALSSLGFDTDEKQIAFMQLLGYLGALDSYKPYKNTILKSEEALHFLNKIIQFNQLNEAFQWFTLIANQMIKISCNIRHIPELMNIFSKLGFVDPVDCPLKTEPSELILHDGYEYEIRENIKSLNMIPFLCENLQKPVPLSFLTGARGILNSEPSLAAILASNWFNQPEKTHLIQAALNKNKEGWPSRVVQTKLSILSELGLISKEYCVYLNGLLDGLKHQISIKHRLPEMERDSINSAESVLENMVKPILLSYWPHGKSRYDDCPEKYDEFTADWPVSSDLAEFALKTENLSPQILKNISFTPIVAKSKRKKMATPVDNFNEWKFTKGSFLQNQEETPEVIYLSRQPRIKQHQSFTDQYVKGAYRIVAIGQSLTDKGSQEVFDSLGSCMMIALHQLRPTL